MFETFASIPAGGTRRGAVRVRARKHEVAGVRANGASTKKTSNGSRTPSVEVRVARRFRASAKRVFDAWLDPATASAWLFATALHPIARAEIDARVGGAFRFVDRREDGAVEHSGRYVDIIRARRLTFTLSTPYLAPAVTRVRVDFAPGNGYVRGNNGTRTPHSREECELVVTHQGVPGEFADRIEERWTGMLYGLGVTLQARPED